MSKREGDGRSDPPADVEGEALPPDCTCSHVAGYPARCYPLSCDVVKLQIKQQGGEA